MRYQVTLCKGALRDLEKVPEYIKLKFLSWAKTVEIFGLPQVRLLPGYHDEQLKGQRAGQRSIRLSKAYRAIYVTRIDNGCAVTEIVEVQEINKHKY